MNETALATYLMLVTFITPGLDKLGADHLKLLDASPFAGVAVKLMSAYDVGSVPNFQHFQAAIRLCRDHRIDVWPWVFLNRMIGRHPQGRFHSGAPTPEYFRRINVMDLDNETSARDDFLKIWRLALRIARELGAPGIVADFEAYNNYYAYDPRWVAEKRGETVEQVIEKLRRLGAELADIVAEEYPGATIVQLFFDPYATPYKGPDGQPLTRTCNYINLGLLDRAVERNIDLVVVDGGETSVGYYNPSVERLRQKIAAREQQARKLLEKYHNRLVLGGTIAPYADARKITGWLKRAAGLNPPLKTAEDFVPLLRELFSAYRLVWIYGAGSSATDPFKPETIAPVYKAIERALETAPRR